MLGSRRGWSGRESATRGAVLVYGGERPPDDFFKDFGGRLRSLTETTRHINPHGPASVSMVGVNMWGERIEGDDLFLAPWGALVFESLGWRRAQCPPDVDPLDVAWYPPAKDGSP
ncbi:MAG TPA: hypothetical protein VFS43_09695 [Polyangiaceae bacterium]|nr:hypothetical protein [Polyangiaceae bacterium]